MPISSFLKLVEIQTKVASVIPYLLGTLYAFFAFDTFRPLNALLMFASLFIFDMTTTAINNYIDFAKAVKKDGYGYECHNAIVRDELHPRTVRFTIYGMLFLAALLGVILFLRTNWIVLLLGIFSFLVGIFYSFGPIPISRTPFGEIFSGLTMGFLIPFIAIYIHIYDQDLITLGLAPSHFTLSFNITLLLSLFIVTLPLVVGIANIMLANNICDMEDDIINKRYTLPIYIGREAALHVFAALYYIGFIAIALGILLQLLPLTSILTFLALKPIVGHIQQFKACQSKAETFILAVKNFVLLGSLYVLTLLLGILINILL
ncbi:MAG: 1,4-dihydroxy-2-naphthoate polyprenyltransferase [Cellulosilyticaceae bacterium]